MGAFQSGGLGGSVRQTIGNNGAFEASVQALERANVLRTLAEPTLTAQSGREATFLAGGEVNLPTSSSIDDGVLTIETTARTVGVSLSFTPIVQSAERISITLNTEVSAVDPTQADAGIGGVTFPGVSVRRASSTIELPSGGTMIVGGLLKDDLRRTSSGLPYLKNVPILGPLFGLSLIHI